MIPITALHGAAHTRPFAITAGPMHSGAAQWNFAASPTSRTTEVAGSTQPQRDGAHLDTHARRGARVAMRVVERDMRHAVRTHWIAVVGLEDQHLISPHLGIPVPAMRRIM